MEKPNKKCFLKEHKESLANFYCPECKKCMCNKCENTHSQVLYFHEVYTLNEDIDQIFTGFCKENEHNNKLEYFCKTHNKLCCCACISKIKSNNKGQHNECDIYEIEDIQEEKKNLLKKNIKNLEELSNNIEESINELKQFFVKILENKEELKLKIQTLFTKIRATINEREDNLLLEVDKIYEQNFIGENIIKEITKLDKLPNRIKTSIEKGKWTEKDWKDENKLSLINNCINIEDNIALIKLVNQDLTKCKDNIDSPIIFYPEEGYILDKLFNNIINFGKIYQKYNTNSINDANFNIEIRSIDSESNGISVELNKFKSENYNKYFTEDMNFENAQIVITICLETMNNDSLDSLWEIFNESFLKDFGNELFDFNMIKKNDKLFLIFIINNTIFEKYKELFKYDINFWDFINLSIKYTSNLDLNNFCKMSDYKLFFDLLSFIFSIKVGFNDLQKFIKFFDKNKKSEIISFLNLIRQNFFQNTKIEFSFAPNKMAEIIKKII